jgi:hypothetical protein
MSDDFSSLLSLPKYAKRHVWSLRKGSYAILCVVMHCYNAPNGLMSWFGAT